MTILHPHLLAAAASAPASAGGSAAAASRSPQQQSQPASRSVKTIRTAGDAFGAQLTDLSVSATTTVSMFNMIVGNNLGYLIF